MKYLTEEDEKPLRLRLLPAIRHPDGTIRTGKRGIDHSEIREKYADEEGPMKGEAGFYDLKEKAFLSRSEAAKHAPRQGASGESTEFLTPPEREARAARLKGTLNTPDMMTPMQRMHKYGTFEESVEKDKNLGKYLRAAIKHKDTGELYRGPSILSSHFETRQHHGLGPEHEAGFIDKRDPKVFISREDAAKRGAGSETTENLSSWGKYRRAIGLRPDDPDAAGGSLSSGDLAPKNSAIGRFRLNLREKKDFMIAFRQKIDAKRLAPTRSGSKGGSADGDE